MYILIKITVIILDFVPFIVLQRPSLLCKSLISANVRYFVFLLFLVCFWVSAVAEGFSIWRSCCVTHVVLNSVSQIGEMLMSAGGTKKHIASWVYLLQSHHWCHTTCQKMKQSFRNYLTALHFQQSLCHQYTKWIDICLHWCYLGQTYLSLPLIGAEYC